jgi:CBS domain-containing protein/uncharacterized protein (DUF2267 family)
MKSIQSLIQRKVVVLYDDATVGQAARAMKEHQIGCVIVSDHANHIVGIVTDRDLVNGMQANARKATNQVKILEVMTRKLASVNENADLKRVISLMEEHGVRRIPVIHKLPGDTERCVGIVTLDDLVASKAIDLQHLTRIIRSQLRRRIWPVKVPHTLSTNNQQELDRFYDSVASKMTPKLEFTRGELEHLSSVVLGALVQRLHHTGSMHLIGQLPSSLQPTLLNLPPGPNETMTSERLVREVCRLFNVDDPTAYAVLVRFCAGLEEWCESKVLDHVKAQLPKDLYALFSMTEVELEKKKAAA